MSARSPRAVRALAALACLSLAVTHASTAAAQDPPGATTTSVTSTTRSAEQEPDATHEAAHGDGHEDHASPAELGITSTEIGPAEAGESAQAVPFLGTYEVWCTQGNPSPGICGSHHSYPAIDLGMPVGTTINASGPGIVHEARSSDGDARGLYVTLRHPDGIYSRYLHLSAISVEVGQAVETGTVIGRSGNSGSSTAPHLHYDEQRPLGTSKDIGDMVGYTGTEQIIYPRAFGYDRWSSVRFGTLLRNDSFESPTPVTPRQWGGPTVATGDFDGDGYDDIVAGVPAKDSGGVVDAGAVLVIPGSADGAAPERSRELVPGGQEMPGTAGAGDVFGAAVATGDFDGDGYDDVAIGVPREDIGGATDSGAIVVVPGSANGLDPSSGRRRSAGSGLPGAPHAGDQLGAALAAGDFDGDGLDDLAIGAPGEDVGEAPDAGTVVVVFGTERGLGGTGMQLAAGAAGLAGRSQAGDLLGAAVAAGDLNGDGFDDLAMGAPGQDVGQATNAGEVIAVAGAEPRGFDRVRSQQLRTGVGDMVGRSERDDVFGAALAIGQVTGGAPADLIVGAPGEDADAVNDGAITVVPGSETAPLGPDSRQHWSGSNGSAVEPRDQDLLGAALAVGDVDGDGRTEILIGVPGKDVGAVRDAGAVVIIGSTDGVLTSDSPEVADASEADDRFGRSVAAGDLNGDGIADLVAAAPTETVRGLEATGALTAVPGSSGAGLSGAGSAHFVRGQGGLAGRAKQDDHFGGLLPPYLF